MASVVSASPPRLAAVSTEVRNFFPGQKVMPIRPKPGAGCTAAICSGWEWLRCQTAQCFSRALELLARVLAGVAPGGLELRWTTFNKSERTLAQRDILCSHVSPRTRLSVEHVIDARWLCFGLGPQCHDKRRRVGATSPHKAAPHLPRAHTGCSLYDLLWRQRQASCVRGNCSRKVVATMPVHGRTTEPVPPFGLPAPEQRIPCSNAQANWPNQQKSAEGDGSVTFTGCFAALFPVIFPASGKTAETGSHRTASRTTLSFSARQNLPEVWWP